MDQSASASVPPNPSIRIAGWFARLPIWIKIVGGIFAIALLWDIASAILEPPVSISFRNSLVGSGQVMILKNDSGKVLYGVRLKAMNKPLGEYVQGNLGGLAPHDSIEIGWMQGWRFLPGEGYRVSVYGYACDVTGSVPTQD